MNLNKGILKIFCVTSCILLTAVIVRAQEATTQEGDEQNKLLLENTETKVNFGYLEKEKRTIGSSVSTINVEELYKYDNQTDVEELIRGRLLGVMGTSNVRGLGGALIIIDGIPGRDIDNLNMEEVKEITVLKDANAIALYGSEAKNGVIVVTTKRGTVGKTRAKVTANYGIRDAIAYPKYLGSADYMTLYNEARVNDGLDPSFDQGVIDSTRNGVNPYRYPDVDMLSDEYVKPMTDFKKVAVELTGGKNDTKYYVNMGWLQEGEWVKLNPDVNKASNRFSMRGNVDFRVNSFITSSVDVVTVIDRQRNAHTDLLSAATSRKPHIFAPYLPLSLMDTANNETLQTKLNGVILVDNGILGGSSAYKNIHPIADIIAGGYRTDLRRTTQFNNTINFDLDGITEGLSARTYLSFDHYAHNRISVNNDYAIYAPTWQGDSIVDITNEGDDDKRDITEHISSQNFNMRYGFIGQIDYTKDIDENNHLDAGLYAYYYQNERQGNIQPLKNSHLALQLQYAYKNKLFADFSSAYVYSVKLPEGNRTALSPTLSLAYILKDQSVGETSGWLNYLKLKASGGIVNNDVGIDGFYLYETLYEEAGGTYVWADDLQNSLKRMQQAGNPYLGYEKRQDINIGFESVMFSKLYAEFNAFTSRFKDQPTTLSSKYPSFYDPMIPLENSNVTGFSGAELGLHYENDFGTLKLVAGLNVLYSKTEAVKREEFYEYDYQLRQGKPTSAMFGLKDLGFYTENDFDANGDLLTSMPVPAYGRVQPGDIKYEDVNGDMLVDANDEVMIGQSSAKWTYSPHVTLSYKGFTLYALAYAQSGHSARLNDRDYYWIDGDRKYSEFILDRWTPETANTATYPRLSSTRNQNNFRNSTFWLYDNSFFSVERVQLSYQFPQRIANVLKLQGLNIFANGSNLVQIAANKEYRELNIGGNPQYRQYSLGVKVQF